MIDDEPAAQVKETCAVLHGTELFGAKQVSILRLPVDVQRDYIGHFKQLSESHRARVSACEHMCAVVKDHAHAHGFRQVRNLRADLAIAYDPQGKAAHFMCTSGRLVPHSAMHFG